MSGLKVKIKGWEYYFKGEMSIYRLLVGVKLGLKGKIKGLGVLFCYV